MGKAPADWSNDDETVKKERKGYALSGWATGPDTVMSALWSAGLFYSAGLDATCWTSADGYPSGADGAACVAHGNWNQSLFNSVGGHAACSSSDLLGAHLYVHDSKSADCASAFAAYRAAPEYTGGVMYTCNCSGNKNSHAFLGDGGLRPDLTYTTMLTVAGFVLAALFIPMGTASDFLSNRLFVWKMLTHVCFVTTLGMAVVFQGIWIIGLIMCGLTVLSSEIVIPLRASYIRFAAPGGDEATVGYLGGMRQAWSFAAQLLFAILLGGLAFSGVVDAALQSTIMAVLAGVWFEIFMLRVFNNFTEHGALRTREGGMGSLVCFSYTDFAKTLVKICTEIPEAGKVLFVSAMMNVGGGGTLIAISSTFAVVFLDMGALYPLVTISALLVGFPMSLLFAHLRKNDTVSFKMLWLIVGILFLLINVLVPIVCVEPSMTSSLTVIVLAGVFGGTALAWYYATGWSSFVLLTPADSVGQYAALYNSINTLLTPVGPLIYTVVVQSTGSHRLAWAIMGVFTVAALIMVAFINFEKGKQTAAKLSAATPSVESAKVGVSA